VGDQGEEENQSAKEDYLAPIRICKADNVLQSH